MTQRYADYQCRGSNVNGRRCKRVGLYRVFRRDESGHRRLVGIYCRQHEREQLERKGYER